MNIAIVHNSVSDADAPDARDVLFQVETVLQALIDLGHQCLALPCTLDLGDIEKRLKADKFDMVFNLVESLAGHGRLIHLFPFLLDAIGLPYSGSPAEAIWRTSDKASAKKILQQAGLPTPDWLGPYPTRDNDSLGEPATVSGSWIIKSSWEHASIGLDANALLQVDSTASLLSAMRQRLPLLGGSCFAERFIDGREFNLSVLTGSHGPQVLPPAEILFRGFDEETPRIVDYKAKWDEESFAYHNTPRTFSFSAEDVPLLMKLRQLAEKCWHLFALDGYARVDFRVDEENRPWILEINANPCLSPDAGFAAALAQAGISFSEAMSRIITDAMAHSPLP